MITIISQIVSLGQQSGRMGWGSRVGGNRSRKRDDQILFCGGSLFWGKNLLFLLPLTQQPYLCVLLNMAWNSYIDSKPPERSILRYSPFYFLPLNNHRFPFNYARIQKSGYNSTHRHPPASWGFFLCVCVHARVCMFHKSSNREEKHDHLLLDEKIEHKWKKCIYL